MPLNCSLKAFILHSGQKYLASDLHQFSEGSFDYKHDIFCEYVKKLTVRREKLQSEIDDRVTVD